MILYSLERAMQMNLVSGDYVSKAEKLMMGLMENTTIKFEVINSLADARGLVTSRGFSDIFLTGRPLQRLRILNTING